ncbi:alcohol dehydrogenase catalytic domain-containing protein [candidate division KSB1 bacterium]|nr:alcohol dehydrogenase catalytic domain-containing protein [candidate division KSB1 bacterium]
METMQALVFKEPWKLEYTTLPMPHITKPNQVILKVALCGICGSDVKIVEDKHAWKADVVLGHEFTGTVVQVGSDVTAVKPGDRIALDNNSRCGLCDFCRNGFSCQCTELKNRTLGVFKNGGNAQYCLATEDVCFKLPESIDDVTATQVETLATVLNGMNTVQMQPWDQVVVLGFGPIGYLFASMAKNVAARVMVTEIDPWRFNLAKSMGFSVHNPDKTDIQNAVSDMTQGKKADVVIDAVGTQLANALDYVTPGGKILAFGMDSSCKVQLTPYQITRNAVRILGTYIGQNTILPAIRLYEAKKIDMGPFFTETVPLKDALQAYKKIGLDVSARKTLPKQAMKMVLNPWT